MVRAFLNESSIEDAHEAYLVSFDKLPSVRAAWNGKKPTLAQFKKRFGSDYDKRQKRLGRESDPILTARHNDDMSDLIHAKLQELLSGVQGGEVEPEPVEDEPEDDEVESLDIQAMVKDAVAKALGGVVAPEPAKVERTVSEDNLNALPTPKQVAYFIHRAIENGDQFVTIPTTRGIAAQLRGLCDEMEYEKALRKVKRAR